MFVLNNLIQLLLAISIKVSIFLTIIGFCYCYNWKWYKTKYIRCIHTIWDGIISPFKRKVSIIQMVIYKPYIIRDALETSNINGVIILNT